MFGAVKNFLFTVSILLGAIIGAGIFGIPYAIYQSGLLPGLFYFFILGALVTLIHLFFAEILLRTQGEHRLVGLSRKYLAGKGDIFIGFSVVVGTVGSLLAYLILTGDFLKIIFSSWTNLDSFYLTIFFWIILFCFFIRGMKTIAPTTLITNSLFIFIIFSIVVFSLPKVEISNLSFFNSANIFLPFGVIMFSLVGWSSIPAVIEVSKSFKSKINIKKVIIFATAIVLLIYLFFTLSVIGVSGGNVSADAISGLIPFLGKKIIFLGALAGVITLADSFLVLALYLKSTLIYDFKISPKTSVLIAGFAPMVLFLFGFRNFIGTIGFVGTIIGAIEGVIIILIFQKAKTLGDRKPEYSLNVPKPLLYSIVFILIFGAIAQFFLR